MKKSKILVIILSILLICCLSLVLVACGGNSGGDNNNGGNNGGGNNGDGENNPPPTHTHIWSETYNKDETQHWLVCSGCKDKKNVAKHTFMTNSENDTTWQECSVCNYSKDEHTHTWGNEIIIKNPSCKEEGEKTYTCSVCSATKTEKINKLTAHNYLLNIIAPTCTDQGYTTHICECGHSYNDNYIEALGHDFKNYVSNNDATRESDGTKTALCERYNCYEKDTIVDEGTKIVKVKIIFNSNGGTAIDCIIEYPHTKISCPANPTKENYLFEKWQLNGEDYTFTFMPEKDIELFAVWTFYEDGSKEYPFVIKNKEDFFEFVDNVNNGINVDKYYILKSNIDFEEENINSIKEFSGIFDGRGFKLCNFNITEEIIVSEKSYIQSGKYNHASTSAMGMFIRLNEGSTIMNTSLINFSVLKDVRADYVHIGGLVGINLGGTIKNCKANGKIEIKSLLTHNSSVFIGGLIGSNGNMIIVNSIDGSSAGFSYVSSQLPSVCEKCYINININDKSDSSLSRVGGLCGRNASIINQSFSCGKIESCTCSGGLVGENLGQILNCFSNANAVSSDSEPYATCYSGGLVGINQSGRISFCYASGNVSANGGYSVGAHAYAGGLVGLMESGNIYCCVTMNLSILCSGNDEHRDAFVGYSKGTIANSFYYGASNAISNLAEECLHMQLNNIDFYISTLGWDNMIWNLKDLNILNSNTPQLNWYLSD